LLKVDPSWALPALDSDFFFLPCGQRMPYLMRVSPQETSRIFAVLGLHLSVSHCFECAKRHPTCTGRAKENYSWNITWLNEDWKNTHLTFIVTWVSLNLFRMIGTWKTNYRLQKESFGNYVSLLPHLYPHVQS
jgi:cytochrome oxidase assembly protein ShyY1